MYTRKTIILYTLFISIEFIFGGCHRYYNPYQEIVKTKEKKEEIEEEKLWVLIQKTPLINPKLDLTIQKRHTVETIYQVSERRDTVQYFQKYSLSQETNDFLGMATVVLPIVFLIPHLAGERISVPKEVDPKLANIGYWENLLYWTDWFNPLRNFGGGPVSKAEIERGQEKIVGDSKELQFIKTETIPNLPIEISIGDTKLPLITDKQGKVSFPLTSYEGEKDKELVIQIFCHSKNKAALPIQIDKSTQYPNQIKLGDIYQSSTDEKKPRTERHERK